MQMKDTYSHNKAKNPGSTVQLQDTSTRGPFSTDLMLPSSRPYSAV